MAGGLADEVGGSSQGWPAVVQAIDFGHHRSVGRSFAAIANTRIAINQIVQTETTQ